MIGDSPKYSRLARFLSGARWRDVRAILQARRCSAFANDSRSPSRQRLRAAHEQIESAQTPIFPKKKKLVPGDVIAQGRRSFQSPDRSFLDGHARALVLDPGGITMTKRLLLGGAAILAFAGYFRARSPRA